MVLYSIFYTVVDVDIPHFVLLTGKSNLLNIKNYKMKKKPLKEKVNEGLNPEFLCLQSIFSYL